MVSVLGSLRASIVIHTAAILGFGTIILCYILALSFKHVKLWPIPMISDCAVKSPEMFPFRLGLVTSALLMALSSFVIYLAGVPKSKLALVFGVAACSFLAVVAVVNEDEASTVHSVSAVIFFILYWFNMIALTVVSSKVLLPWCRPKTPLGACRVTKLVLRQALTIFCGLALIAAAIAGSSKWDKDQRYLAICEWLGTFAMLVFNWTFSSDLSGVQVAEITEQLITSRGGVRGAGIQSSSPETERLLKHNVVYSSHQV